MKKLFVILSLGVLIIGSGVFYFQIIKGLPDVESLKQVQLQTPLRVYSSDEKLMAEFGKKGGSLCFEWCSKIIYCGFYRCRGREFFSHSGVDWMAMGRAAYSISEDG